MICNIVKGGYTQDGMHLIVQSVDSWYKTSLGMGTTKRHIGLTLIIHVHWQTSGTIAAITNYYRSGEK